MYNQTATMRKIRPHHIIKTLFTVILGIRILDQKKKEVAAQKNSVGFPFGLENLGKWEGIFQLGRSLGILNRLQK